MDVISDVNGKTVRKQWSKCIKKMGISLI